MHPPRSIAQQQAHSPPLTITGDTDAADSTRTYTVSAWVSNESDANTRNNSATYTQVAAGGVPVDVTVLVSGDGPYVAGSEAVFTAEVSNSGTSPSTGDVTVNLSTGFSGAVVTGTGWICTSGLVCTPPRSSTQQQAHSPHSPSRVTPMRPTAQGPTPCRHG